MDISRFMVEERATPPAVGSAKPGNLYADLQSRTIWLGVDTAVNPAGSVLLSDVIGILQEIDDTLAEAKAYTNSQITTRAPVVHKHVAADITDFSGAVTGVVAGIPGFNWVKGMILMWSGSLAEIGVGQLAGWSLCDGSNGTPDLRDRFIVGAGNKLPGEKNSVASFLTDTQGGHTHTINGTTLTAAQIPSHQHYVNGAYGSGNTGNESADHTHVSYLPTFAYVAGTTGSNVNVANSYTTVNTGGRSAAHYHSFGVYVYGWSDATGGGGAHTHTETTAGSHQHNITAQQLRDTLPYYALAFIMKL